VTNVRDRARWWFHTCACVNEFEDLKVVLGLVPCIFYALDLFKAISTSQSTMWSRVISCRADFLKLV